MYSNKTCNTKLHSNRERGDEKEATQAYILVRRGADDEVNKVICLKTTWYKKIFRYFYCTIWLLCFVVWAFAYTPPVFALSAEEIIALKKAGVEDSTIALIIREQADLSGLINVHEVILMKQAGVSDDIIRALANPGEKKRIVKEYGTHVDQIKEISTKDLIQLKKAGFDDRVIEAIIQIQRENLWPYLFDIGVIACPGSLQR